MPHGLRIAEELLNIKAVKLSVNPPFTWTSEIKAPIYCDNRMIYSHPQARDLIVTALAHRVKSLHVPPDFIAGTAMAAIGWAALVADRLKLPFVYVRTKLKEHGMGKLIEGDLPKGKHVVVVEDLISTLKSSSHTVETLRNEGQAVVTDIVSIFTYEFASAAENAERLKVKTHPLCTISRLLEVALSNGEITPDDAVRVSDFTKDPEGWTAR